MIARAAPVPRVTWLEPRSVSVQAARGRRPSHPQQQGGKRGFLLQRAPRAGHPPHIPFLREFIAAPSDGRDRSPPASPGHGQLARGVSSLPPLCRPEAPKGEGSCLRPHAELLAGLGHSPFLGRWLGGVGRGGRKGLGCAVRGAGLCNGLDRETPRAPRRESPWGEAGAVAPRRSLRPVLTAG